MLLQILSALLCFCIYSLFIPYKISAIIMLAVAIHEYGHYFLAKRFKSEEIKLYFIPFFGALISVRDTFNTYESSIITLAGPAAGVIIGSISYIIYLFTGNIYVWLFSMVSIVFNFINLLPLGCMDGSQILRKISIAISNKVAWTVFVLSICLEVLSILLVGFTAYIVAEYFKFRFIYIFPVVSIIAAVYLGFHSYKNFKIDLKYDFLYKHEILKIIISYCLLCVISMTIIYFSFTDFSLAHILNVLR